MDIHQGYLTGSAALAFFTAGYFAFDQLIKRQEAASFASSPAGQFAKRLSSRIGAIDPEMKYFAVAPNGDIWASPYQLYANAAGWDDDREYYIIGSEPETAVHWRESQVTRKQVAALR